MFSINLGWLVTLCLVLNQFHSTSACLRKAPMQPILICEDEALSTEPSPSGVTDSVNVRNETSGDPRTTPSGNGVTTTPVNRQTTSSGTDVKTSTNTPSEVTTTRTPKPKPTTTPTTKPKNCAEVVVRKELIDKADCEEDDRSKWSILRDGLPTECVQIHSASAGDFPLGAHDDYDWCGEGSVWGLMHPETVNAMMAGQSGKLEAWLGPTSTNGVFRMPDGTPLKYAHWKGNHPHSNKIKTKKQCVKVNFGRGSLSHFWEVVDCETTKLDDAVCYKRKAVKTTLCDEQLEDYNRKVASKELWKKKCTYDYEQKDPRDPKKHGKCPSGWTIYRPAAKCYKKLEKNTYEGLISECASLGGNLSSVHTHHQQKFLRALLGEHAQLGDFYIGLDRKIRANEKASVLPERFEDGSVRDFGLWPDDESLMSVTVDKGVGGIGDPRWEDTDGTGEAYGICSLNVPGNWNVAECEHYVEPNGSDY